MNFKQFRQLANGHSRTAFVNGRIVGGRGFRLMSKIGQNAQQSLLIALNATTCLNTETLPQARKILNRF